VITLAMPLRLHRAVRSLVSFAGAVTHPVCFHLRSHMHRPSVRKSGNRPGSGHASGNALLHVNTDSKGSSDQ
jgi:hypothetical protein